MNVCTYCRGARLVGWSGAGPILCPTCSHDMDPSAVLVLAWREQRGIVREITEILRALPSCPLCGEVADNGNCSPECRLGLLVGAAPIVRRPIEGEVYGQPSSDNEVIIDHVTDTEVLFRLTDGRLGLLAARRLPLAVWEEIRVKHGMVVTNSIGEREAAEYQEQSLDGRDS